MNFNILRFDSIGSTNTEAARHAKLGAGEGLCVIARQQTDGRGRYGRQWVSERDAGLYFSLVLRPQIEFRYLPLITLMAGVAVHDTIREFGMAPDIKWVNDILVGDKKISGILAESIETPTGLAVILGIGINLTSNNFPSEIAATATSIEAEAGKTVEPDDLAEALTRSIASFYEILNGPNGPTEILENWRRRSSYFSGRSVRVATGSETITGITDGLEENGSLRVKTADGSVKLFQAGDVQRIRPNEI